MTKGSFIILPMKNIAIFVSLLVAASLHFDASKLEAGTIDFWSKHGVFFLVSISFFPRLTLLFSSVATGGLLWWLGFFFCPRVLVASLATVTYFQTNPVLVYISWVVALSGEVFEKKSLGSGRFQVHTFRSGPARPGPQRDATPIHDDNVIEAEFTKK